MAHTKKFVRDGRQVRAISTDAALSAARQTTSSRSGSLEEPLTVLSEDEVDRLHYEDIVFGSLAFYLKNDKETRERSKRFWKF